MSTSAHRPSPAGRRGARVHRLEVRLGPGEIGGPKRQADHDGLLDFFQTISTHLTSRGTGLTQEELTDLQLVTLYVGVEKGTWTHLCYACRSLVHGDGYNSYWMGGRPGTEYPQDMGNLGVGSSGLQLERMTATGLLVENNPQSGIYGGIAHGASVDAVLFDWLGRGNVNTNARGYEALNLAIDALAAGGTAVLGSDSNVPGLNSPHAYTVVHYDAATSMFTLRNPWGYQDGGRSGGYIDVSYHTLGAGYVWMVSTRGSLDNILLAQQPALTLQFRPTLGVDDTGARSDDGITRDTSLAIGQLEPGAGLLLRIDGGAWTEAGQARFGDPTITAREGRHTDEVVATDGKGGRSPVSTSLTIDLDTRAPAAHAVTLVSPGVDHSTLQVTGMDSRLAGHGHGGCDRVGHLRSGGAERCCGPRAQRRLPRRSWGDDRFRSDSKLSTRVHAWYRWDQIMLQTYVDGALEYDLGARQFRQFDPAGNATLVANASTLDWAHLRANTAMAVMPV